VRAAFSGAAPIGVTASVSAGPAKRGIVIVYALDTPTGPVFSKQADGSRGETSSMHRRARIFPQGPRLVNIGCACHSEESLGPALGLPT